MSYLINHEKFASGPSLVDAYRAAKEAPMPKLNVKVRKADLRIIDEIATQSGTPRSQIINSMIDSILQKMLRELYADDPDCAALVARHADSASSVSYSERGSWSDLVFACANPKLENYYGNELPQRPADSFSDQFHTIEERLRKAAP